MDQIITSNGFPLLRNAGSLSHEEMEVQTAEKYLEFDQRRKEQEAREADQEDAADLEDLEQRLKERSR